MELILLVVLSVCFIVQGIILTWALSYIALCERRIEVYQHASRELYDAAYHCLPELPIVEDISDWHEAMCNGDCSDTGEDMAEYLRSEYAPTAARQGVAT